MFRETNRSPCTRARGRSCGANAGRTFAIAVSTDSPAPQPSSRFKRPKSAPSRTAARAPSSGPSSSIRPSTALARTRVRPCSRPSASRRRWWPAGSSSARSTTKTSAPSTSTPCARTSSAKGSRVPPEARSKRAWCQWQVKRPFSTVPRWRGKPICGQRSSTANASPSAQNTQTGCEPTLPARQPFACRSSVVPILARCGSFTRSTIARLPSM